MTDLDWLLSLIQQSYQRSPFLLLALSALAVLPVIALISFLVQVWVRSRRTRAAARLAQRKAQAATPGEETGAGSPVASWPSQAWLTVEGGRRDMHPLLGQMIRIGRHADNDIRLADSSVHRYHAMILRTPEEDFVITDLSGTRGNGVRVNGARLERARLADGDVIELGRAKLKFESAPL